MNENYNYRATKSPETYDLRLLYKQREIVDSAKGIETLVLFVLFLAAIFLLPMPL